MSAETIMVVGGFASLAIILGFGLIMSICQCSNTKDDFVPEGWETDKVSERETKELFAMSKEQNYFAGYEDGRKDAIEEYRKLLHEQYKTNQEMANKIFAADDYRTIQAYCELDLEEIDNIAEQMKGNRQC